MAKEHGNGPIKIRMDDGDLGTKTVVVYLFSRQKAPKKLFICNRPLNIKRVLDRTKWEAVVYA